MLQRRPHGTRRTGFTLIELIVVLVVIAVLAGLAIPVVNMLTRTSSMTASAKTQADLANNLQMFYTLQKRYPQGLDSLLDSGGAIYASDTSDPNTQTRGLPYAGADGTRLQAQLTASPLTNATGAEWLRSFTRAGFDWVYNHDTAAVDSNISGTIRNPASPDTFTSLGSSLTTLTVAEVTGTALRDKLVPAGLTAGQRLIALGVGPRNAAISKTITNCPIYPGNDGKYYGRFVAVFMIYATGERCTLVSVIDPYGRHPDYTMKQVHESLPDGARQD